MVEPVTDVEALISWLDDVGHNHSSGSVYANAATALRTLQERVKELETAVRWALGEGDSDFAEPVMLGGTPRYWWRAELRRRAALKGADQ